MEELHHQLNVLRVRLEALTRDYFGPQFCSEVQDYVLSHPFIAIALLGSGLLSVVPIIIFIIFALVTGGFGVIAFVCIEGVIIGIAGLILIGVISFITLITVGLTSFLATVYWTSYQLHKTLCHYRRLKKGENDLSAVTRSRSSQSRRLAHSEGLDGNITPDSSNGQDRSSDVSENYEVVN